MAVKKLKPKKIEKSLKSPVVKTPLTKSGIIKTIMDMTGQMKQQVAYFMQALEKVMEAHVQPKGPGKFVYPGLLKITIVKKPAKPAYEGNNPFTGEKMKFKAKPAYKAVKIKALKKLKEMVQ